MGPFSHRGGAGSLSLFGEFADNISPFFPSDSIRLIAFPAFTAETYVSGMAAVLWVNIFTLAVGACVRWVRAERELAFIVWRRELFTGAFVRILFDSPLVILVIGLAPDLIAFEMEVAHPKFETLRTGVVPFLIAAYKPLPGRPRQVLDVRILGPVNAHDLAGSVISVPRGGIRRGA